MLEKVAESRYWYTNFACRFLDCFRSCITIGMHYQLRELCKEMLEMVDQAIQEAEKPQSSKGKVNK